MKIAYYTSLFSSISRTEIGERDASDAVVAIPQTNDSDKDNYRVLLFSVWLYYLIRSGSFDAENDGIYVVCDEKINAAINGSNLYKFVKQLYGGVKFINVQLFENENQLGYMKYFPPVIDIMVNDKCDYVFYCDVLNLIRGNMRAKFENAEENPTGYVVFEKNITDEHYFSYVKNTEWYSKNKEVVDKLPAINGGLFCMKNGVNEVAFLKSIFNHVANDYSSDSVLNETLYSHSQYLAEKCYIELNAEVFFKSVEINKLDSAREIILLRDIDVALMNETLMILLLCKLEKL